MDLRRFGQMAFRISMVGVWAAKMECANKIYLQLRSFCEFLNTLSIAWSIENPAGFFN